MISKEDVIAFSGLEEDEILAIAEHEHIPEMAAAALGRFMLHEEKGPEHIRDMIVDDIRAALDADNDKHAAELFMALRHFIQHHLPADAK